MTPDARLARLFGMSYPTFLKYKQSMGTSRAIVAPCRTRGPKTFWLNGRPKRVLPYLLGSRRYKKLCKTPGCLNLGHYRVP